MADSKVNRDNYIVIQGWFLTDLKLKGNELIIYSCIYGFSQAENQAFTGSLQYLADWTNSTKQGVMKSLKSLVEKGYIEKTDKIFNGVKFCEYRATKFNGVLNNVDGGIKQSLTGGMQQSCNNNLSFNTSNNTISDKEERKKGSTYDDILNAVNDPELKDLYIEYIKMRKMIKAPLTDRALKMLIAKVNELEPADVNRQKQLLETAIMNNWKSVYPLKDQQQARQSTQQSNNVFLDIAREEGIY